MGTERNSQSSTVCADTRSGTTCTARKPGRGRSLYLPESLYFDAEGFPVVRAARVTARYVARWATSFEARPIVGQGAVQNGMLPAERAERSAMVDELFSRLEQEAGQWPTLISLLLCRDDGVILDQHDGIPGLLTLTSRQFSELRDYWEREDLPRDLYYAAGKQRTVIEKVEDGGEVLLAERRYSPLRWKHRDVSAVDALRLPTEEERLRSFKHACLRFVRDLMSRDRQLREPGRRPNPEQLAEVEALMKQVGRTIIGIERRHKPIGNE